MSTDKAAVARAFVLAGIPVFPIAPFSKKPLTPNGQNDRSADLAQFETWLTQFPNCNWAFIPEDAGLCVIDLDPKSKDAWVEVCASAPEDDQVPLTLEVATPRGGTHLYFKGSLPPTVKKLGADIDTRGRNSYVLLPGSEVHNDDETIGAYTVKDGRAPASLPAFISRRLERRVSESVSGLGEVRPDLEVNVARARRALADLVARHDVAVEGRGSDQRTYAVACELRGLGVAEHTAYELMAEIWWPHCVLLKGDLEYLETKVHNAYRYAQEPGRDAAGEPNETFKAAVEAGVLGGSEEAPEQPKEKSRFHWMDEKEQDAMPEPKWLIPGLIPDYAAILWLGSKGHFKSFLLEDVALAVAAGVNTFGQKPLRLGKVFYAAEEGRASIARERRYAWRLAREVTSAIPIFVGPAPKFALGGDDRAAWTQSIKDKLDPMEQPGLIILDTVSQIISGLDENSAEVMTKFTDWLKSLVEFFDCSVVAVHHLGKTNRTARGHSSLEANLDTVIEVDRPKEHLDFVKVSIKYHRDADRGKPWYFQGKKILGTLVFNPTTSAQFAEAVGDDDEFSPSRVGDALRANGATTRTKGTSIQTLAAWLSADPNDATEKARIIRELKKRKSLAGHHTGAVWWVPVETEKSS